MTMTRVSFKKRLEKCKAAEVPLFDELVSDFFGAVSREARTGYPEWVLETIGRNYNVRPAHLYGALVAFAEELLENPSWKEEGEELMYWLLIEPFCIVDEEDAAKEAAVIVEKKGA